MEERGREGEGGRGGGGLGKGGGVRGLQLFSSTVAMQCHFWRSLLQRGGVCSLSLWVSLNGPTETLAHKHHSHSFPYSHTAVHPCIHTFIQHCIHITVLSYICTSIHPNAFHPHRPQYLTISVQSVAYIVI